MSQPRLGLLVSRVFLVALAAAALSSCGLVGGRQAAVRSVDTFHQQFNESRFADIYSATTRVFKNAAGETQFTKFVQTLQRKLGRFEHGNPTKWQTNVTPGGTFVVLVYDCRFERAAAVETFTFVLSGEKAVLQGYNVNSAALLLN